MLYKEELDSDGNPIIKKIKNKNGEEVEVEVYETKEVDIKALIFGIKEMINEAIDIDNENNQLNQPLLTEKQVGRLITAMNQQRMIPQKTSSPRGRKG